MTPLLDERPIVKALLGVLNDASAEWDAYSHGMAPGDQNAPPHLRGQPIPDLFALVGLERRFAEPVRAVKATSQVAWRLTVQALGTTVNEARGVGRDVSLALDSATLLVEGRPTTRIQLESHSAPIFDDGRFVSDYVWTLVH